MEQLYEAYWPVDVNPVYGRTLLKLQERLDIVEREAEHLKTAIRGLRSGVARDDVRAMYDTLRNSRNWTASLVISHSYVQAVLGAVPVNDVIAGRRMMAPGGEFQGEIIFSRAAKIGTKQGKLDRLL